ncbi:MAG: hypothetical protein AAGJ92_07655 [Pseudomonadota bacterium]
MRWSLLFLLALSSASAQSWEYVPVERPHVSGPDYVVREGLRAAVSRPALTVDGFGASGGYGLSQIMESAIGKDMSIRSERTRDLFFAIAEDADESLLGRIPSGHPGCPGISTPLPIPCPTPASAQALTENARVLAHVAFMSLATFLVEVNSGYDDAPFVLDSLGIDPSLEKRSHERYRRHLNTLIGYGPDLFMSDAKAGGEWFHHGYGAMHVAQALDLYWALDNACHDPARLGGAPEVDGAARGV